MLKKAFNSALITVAVTSTLLVGGTVGLQEGAAKARAALGPSSDLVRHAVLYALHGATLESKALPVTAECLVQFTFHGTPEDYPRSEYWLDFFSEDLQHIASFSPTTFCAQYTPAWLAKPCEGNASHAWCALHKGFTTPAQGSHSKQPYQQVDVVIATHGGANTRNGIVYLTSAHSGLTFRHEIGHALGLADEYPMRADLAQAFCGGEYNFSALNVVITQAHTLNEADYQTFRQSLPWFTHVEQELGELQDDGYWRLGSVNPNKIGLFPADTCANSNYQAWKPIAQKTFMEQHEIGVVPPLYWQLIMERIAAQ